MFGRKREIGLDAGGRMPPWTAALVAAALFVQVVFCDDLQTSASRRTLSRFELGNPDNTKCWDRHGKDGFYTVIDSHNHFRYKHFDSPLRCKKISSLQQFLSCS